MYEPKFSTKTGHSQALSKRSEGPGFNHSQDQSSIFTSKKMSQNREIVQHVMAAHSLYLKVTDVKKALANLCIRNVKDNEKLSVNAQPCDKLLVLNV